jgi:hypothetical protein
MTEARVILYHKQATSARTLFLSIDKSVCLFGGLPKLSQLKEGGDSNVAFHPAHVIAAAERTLGLDSGSLQVEGEFQAEVDTPDAGVPVFLARITTMDPPRAQMEQHGGRFIALTEARSYPPTELELLRQAYAVIMEG